MVYYGTRMVGYFILGIKSDEEKVDWEYISQYQELPEDFIDKYSDKVDWYYVSQCQTLSENLIDKYSNKVDWNEISIYQILSESFIEKYSDKVNWYAIVRYQTLSEDFIEKYLDKLNLEHIAKYQKLSQEFMEKYHIPKPKNSWLYVSPKKKMKAIKDCGKYEIDGDYVIAYKVTRKNGISCYYSKYVYEVGKVYESHCDCNIDEKHSFGLSARTKEKALDYYPHGELYKVKIHSNNIGALVKDSKELRCFKFEIIERIK